MITRDLGDVQIVTAFDLRQFGSSAYGSTALGMGTVCACGGPNPLGTLDAAYTGYLIDRLGLRRNFATALVVPTAVVNPQYCASSTVAGDKFYALSYGIQHATATGGTFKNLSTGEWVTKQGLYHRTTTTSTADTSSVNRDSLPDGSTDHGLGFVLSSAAATTTSTG